MALISCPECSKEISDKAAACPHCGCPRASTTSNYVSLNPDPMDVMNGFGFNEDIVCPHCQKHGCVMIKRVKMKKGMSGAKATGALLTGGLSILATGLSRKEWATEAHCTNCKSQWHF